MIGQYKTKISSLLRRLSILGIMMFAMLLPIATWAQTLENGTYTISNNVTHDNPVGQGMARSYTEATSDVEVSDKGIYVSLAFNNTQYMGDFTISVDGSKVSYETTALANNIKKLKFKVPSLGSKITVGLYVEPMSTTVEYTVTLSESSLKLVKKAETTTLQTPTGNTEANTNTESGAASNTTNNSGTSNSSTVNNTEAHNKVNSNTTSSTGTNQKENSVTASNTTNSSQVTSNKTISDKATTSIANDSSVTPKADDKANKQVQQNTEEITEKIEVEKVEAAQETVQEVIERSVEGSVEESENAEITEITETTETDEITDNNEASEEVKEITSEGMSTGSKILIAVIGVIVIVAIAAMMYFKRK